MNARELAVDLAMLRDSERQLLLDELPPRKRAELDALLKEIAQLQSAPVPAANFEEHMTAAEAGPFDNLNDGQLRLLLSAEHSAVQHRILMAVRDGKAPALAPAVAAVVTEYLTRKVRANELQGPCEQAGVSRWWQPWKRARQ